MLKKENNLQNKEIQQLNEIVKDYETQLEKVVQRQHQHTEGFIEKIHNRSKTEMDDEEILTARSYRALSPKPSVGIRYKTPDIVDQSYSKQSQSPLSNSPMFEELLREKRKKSAALQGNGSDSKSIEEFVIS